VQPTVYQYDAKENEHKKDQFNHGGDVASCRVELSRLKRAGIVDKHAGRVICPLAIKNDSSAILCAHRGDSQRFIVRADEKLTAFLKLEAAIRVH
jgi:hypothetical protein